MLDWLVRDRELSQIMTNHFRLDFNLVECLAVVHPNDASYHLRHDDHIAQVGFDKIRLLTSWSFPFRFAQFLDQSHGLPLQTSLEPSASTGSEELDELIGGHVEQSVQIDSPEAELLERPLLRLPRRHVHFHVRHGWRERGGGMGEP